MSGKQLRTSLLRALAAAGILAVCMLALPVTLGVLAAAALDPRIRKLQDAGLGRGAASALCSLCALAIAGIVVWILGASVLRELQRLSEHLPKLLDAAAGYSEALSRYLTALGTQLPGGAGDAFRSWAGNLVSGSGALASGLYDRIFSLVSRLLSALPGALFFLMTMVLSCFFAAAELPRLRELAELHLPRRYISHISGIAGILHRAAAGWLRAQASLFGVTFLILLAGFLLLRTDSPVLLALTVSILDALPVLGAGTVLIPWAALSMMTGQAPFGVGLLLLYASTALARNILAPRFLGAQMGLSPLTTLGAIYAGWRIGGFRGMLLLPLAVMTGAALYARARMPAAENGEQREKWGSYAKYPEK